MSFSSILIKKGYKKVKVKSRKDYYTGPDNTQIRVDRRKGVVTRLDKAGNPVVKVKVYNKSPENILKKLEHEQ